MEQFFTYCREEKVNVLFLTTPWARGRDESLLAQFNTINDMALENGFPVLNMLELLDEIGLDLSEDYYDYSHTNIHGCVKVTEYLSRYLIDHYGFADKRGQPGYADWDEAYEAYVEAISPYALDFEYAGGLRDPSLAAPALSSLTAAGTGMTLTWKAAEGAEGYRIYRKELTGDRETGWIPLDRVDQNTLTYTDTGLKPGTTYAYTAASFREEGGETLWGFYDPAGLSAAALPEAPVLDPPEGGENALTLAWTAVEGAERYEVWRRVAGKTWIQLADVREGTEYTDRRMLANMPYAYRVRSVTGEGDEALAGSYSNEVLYVPELLPPVVSVALEEGTPVVSWRPVNWAAIYRIFRKTGDGDWVRLTDKVPETRTSFRDLTVPEGAVCSYRVEPYFNVGKDGWATWSATEEVTAGTCAHPLPPVTVVFAGQTGSGVQLLWETQAGADAYRVCRRVQGDAEWTTVIKSAEGSSALDIPKKKGTYEYLVQALWTVDGVTYLGDLDEGAAVTVTYKR